MADGGQPLRVLCLEDSPVDAELVSETLIRAGYELDHGATFTFALPRRKETPS